MTQVEFERFPFTMTGTDIAPGELIARNSSFVPTKRIQKILEETTLEAEPEVPSFSEEQLKEAEEIAYRKGFDDGEKKGLAYAESEVAKIEQAALDLIPTITQQMQLVMSVYSQFITEQKQCLPKLSLAIGKKLYGTLPPEHIVEQLANHTTQCIETMLGEPELHVYVNPKLTDIMEIRLANHFANSHEPGDVLIHKDESLALSDCRVEWRTGGMEYSAGTVMNQLEQLVEGLSLSVSNAEPPTLINTDGDEDPSMNDAVAGAIAGQLAKDVIPPIPEAPVDNPNPVVDTHATQPSHITPDQGGTNE